MFPWSTPGAETLRALKDAAVKAAELAWWDGARTGFAVGLIAGVVIGLVVARLLRERG